jgi:hypothetical protein
MYDSKARRCSSFAIFVVVVVGAGASLGCGGKERSSSGPGSWKPRGRQERGMKMESAMSGSVGWGDER